MIGWMNNKWKIINEISEKFVLSTVLQNKRNGFVWTVSSVYGPHCNRERLVFWQELRNLKNIVSGVWVVVGDFNVTINPDERKGKTSHKKEMEEFNEVINDWELIDSPLHGRKFTWSNKRRSPSMARLDRVCFNSDWEDKFSFF